MSAALTCRKKIVLTYSRQKLSHQLHPRPGHHRAQGRTFSLPPLASVLTIPRGKSGGSCTFVPQRFMKMFLDQTSPFAAKVYFFTSEEIRQLITLLFGRYYRAAGLDKDEPEEPDDSEPSAQSYTDKSNFLDAAMALFGNQEDFATESKAEEFLAKVRSEDDEDILETMIGWALELVAVHLEDQEFVYAHGSTADDLNHALQPYNFTLVGAEANGATALWPLVSVIDFGLDHPLLNEGIILVDLPGKSDVSTLRADNAARWHRMCTHKILVAQVGRITHSQSLREELAMGHHTRGSGNVMLVLTYGDECDGDTDLAGTALEKRSEHILKDEMTALNQEKRKLNLKRQKPSVSRDEKDDIDEDVKAVTKRYKKKSMSSALSGARCATGP